MARRYYSSTAARTTLASGVDDTTTTLSVVAVSGWPASYPYTLVIDQDTVNEELVEVSARTGTTLTVTRGVDGTSAVAHDAGAAVNHGVSARDFDEPNEFINGTGVVTESMLASNAVTSAKILDGTIVNADINASAAIAQSKIADLTSDLASKLPYSYGTATPSTTDSGFLWYDSNSTPAAPKFWDGSAFQDFPAGLALITTESFSAVSSISLNGCFTSAHDNYKIVASVTNSSDNQPLLMRLRASGSDATGAGTYKVASMRTGSTDTSTAGDGNDSANSWFLTYLYAADASICVLDVLSPNDATVSFFTGRTTYYTTTFQQLSIAGIHDVATSYDGFTFFPASGNLTGTIRVYGYKD